MRVRGRERETLREDSDRACGERGFAESSEREMGNNISIIQHLWVYCKLIRLLMCCFLLLKGVNLNFTPHSILSLFLNSSFVSFFSIIGYIKALKIGGAY